MDQPEQENGSKINMVDGLVDNMTAIIDPAFPEWADQNSEHRSIFQVFKQYFCLLRISNSRLYIDLYKYFSMLIPIITAAPRKLVFRF